MRYELQFTIEDGVLYPGGLTFWLDESKDTVVVDTDEYRFEMSLEGFETWLAQTKNALQTAPTAKGNRS